MYGMNTKIIILIILIVIIALTGATTLFTSTSANVVVSGSMEPAIYKGDVVIVDKNPTNIHVGDIIV
jgi:signal peptidase I